MIEHDPIKETEKLVREIHDIAHRRSRSVIRRYPLLFAFLGVFSFAAIIHGFDGWIDQVGLLHNHPLVLVFLGVLVLILTGTLYSALEKIK